MSRPSQPRARPAKILPWTCPPTKSGRYSRHLLLPEVGMEGQRALKAARVLCIGAGGLGSPVAMYLAAAGVGTLGVVDYDVVDYSNLQRQLLHVTRDVGRPKVESARRAAARRSTRTCGSRRTRSSLTSANALDLFSRYDLVVDGTDNFPTRYLVNDACVLTRPAVRLRQHLPVRGPGVGVRGAEAARATAACIPSRRRRAWCRVAPRAACSACCRASSGPSRRPRRSS